VIPHVCDVKTYFAGSIRGEKPDPAWLQTLISGISVHGKVLVEHSLSYGSGLSAFTHFEKVGTGDAQMVSCINRSP